MSVTHAKMKVDRWIDCRCHRKDGGVAVGQPQGSLTTHLQTNQTDTPRPRRESPLAFLEHRPEQEDFGCHLQVESFDPVLEPPRPAGPRGHDWQSGRFQSIPHRRQFLRRSFIEVMQVEQTAAGCGNAGRLKQVTGMAGNVNG